MITENKTKNTNYLKIILSLQTLRDQKAITQKEYERAKVFYQKLTGADIVIAS